MHEPEICSMSNSGTDENMQKDSREESDQGKSICHFVQLKDGQKELKTSN